MSRSDNPTRAALQQVQPILDAMFPGHLVVLVVGAPLEDPPEWLVTATRNCCDAEARRVLTRAIDGLTEEEGSHVQH